MNEHQCAEPICKFMGVIDNTDTWLCNHASNPNAPGVVRYITRFPKKVASATWVEWFKKYGSFLDGNALQEAHNLYKKDIGEAYWADPKDLEGEKNVN